MDSHHIVMASKTTIALVGTIALNSLLSGSAVAKEPDDHDLRMITHSAVTYFSKYPSFDNTADFRDEFIGRGNLSQCKRDGLLIVDTSRMLGPDFAKGVYEKKIPAEGRDVEAVLGEIGKSIPFRGNQDGCSITIIQKYFIVRLLSPQVPKDLGPFKVFPGDVILFQGS